MSSISWTLLHVCGGADISRVEQEQEQEQVEAGVSNGGVGGQAGEQERVIAR